MEKLNADGEDIKKSIKELKSIVPGPDGIPVVF